MDAAPNSTSASHTLAVRSASASYIVEVGVDLLPEVGERLDGLTGGAVGAGRARIFIVSSPELYELWGAALCKGFTHPPTLLEMPAGEQHKRLSTVERLLEELAAAGADRDSILLALGGGVVGDLTGFLAAIYMRGIRFVQLPTTLLAQVDSSVGGKTGANLAAGKNLVGSFHHPLAVYADTATLRTLPPAELRAGLQEAVKSAIIRDRDLFSYLEQHHESILRGDVEAMQHVVVACVRIKAEVVAADEREGSLRMILNLGHTLGHAIEAATNYTGLLHGEAVAWGMLAALHIAERRGTVNPHEARRMQAVIRTYGPPKPFTADPADLVALTSRDKKNRGGTRSFVLPVGIGDAVVVSDLAAEELLEAATAICNEARQA